MPVTEKLPELTHAEWLAEAVRRFGKDPKGWRFVCPSCGYVASGREWIDRDAPDMVAFSCVGRLVGNGKEMGDKTGGPCNYAGGGLFRLNPQAIKMDDGEVSHAFAFAFADPDPATPVPQPER